MAIVLIIKTEDGQTTELPIIGRVILGRSSTSDIKISDSKISGQHCSFSIDKVGQLLFKDHNSTNGSYINNSRINDTVVKVNDVIRIGNTIIKIDEKKLSPRERQSVGTSPKSVRNEKTVPVLTENKIIKSEPKASKESKEPLLGKKPTIVLNKDHLKKTKAKFTYMEKSNENVIEQEESSGMTKMLKLDKLSKKKKA